MSTSVFDHPWLSVLFDAPQIAPLWQAEAQLAHLTQYERAWTQALIRVGRIAPETGQRALKSIDQWVPDMAGLRQGTATDGVVVPAMVAQMRVGLDGPQAIHSGATSQDVIDTALILTLRQVVQALSKDLAAIFDLLETRIIADGDKPLTGRTRMQAALPILSAHRIQAWQNPVAHLREEADQILSATLALQIGGAVGDGQALGADFADVIAIVGEILDLPVPEASWQTDRGGLLVFSGWLTRITGALGKIGQDICLMSQQGIDEILLEGGGASSAMPHKKNPVQAELLVTLARYAAGQNGLMGQTLLHEQERSGSAWALEWMILPQLTMVAGCATQTTQRLLRSVRRIGLPTA